MSRKHFDLALALLSAALAVIVIIEWAFIAYCGGLSAL